ncbi:MAG: antibiotic biosynthesis monooxygenase [Crocinitomicaceae bacterium]
MLTKTPKPPYYAVIFASIRTEGDNGYEERADKMMDLAKKQSGFLGVDFARSEIGITVSYWQNLESIDLWRRHSEHQLAKEKGKTDWYKNYTLRIAKVEQAY